MNPVQINPYVFAAIISIITFIIGFLLNNTVSSSGRLSRSLAKLDNTVTRLDTTIQGMEKYNTALVNGCKERHEKLDNEVNKIWDKIDK